MHCRLSSAPQPVIDQDFRDPDLLLVEGTYYAYATQRVDGSHNVQLATSTDLSTWEVAEQDVLPTLPAWATSGRTWAPDVTAVAKGYVMYVTAWDADSAGSRRGCTCSECRPMACAPPARLAD